MGRPQDQHHRMPFIGVALILVTACIYADPGTVVRPEPMQGPPTVAFRTFVYPDSSRANRALGVLQVRLCNAPVATEGAVFWEITRGRFGSIPRAIAYGVTPEGRWRVVVPARPLVQGCYEVSTYGGGIGASGTFWIGESGRLDSARSMP